MFRDAQHVSTEESVSPAAGTRLGCSYPHLDAKRDGCHARLGPSHGRPAAIVPPAASCQHSVAHPHPSAQIVCHMERQGGVPQAGLRAARLQLRVVSQEHHLCLVAQREQRNKAGQSESGEGAGALGMWVLDITRCRRSRVAVTVG
jgi:hypothetical protein